MVREKNIEKLTEDREDWKKAQTSPESILYKTPEILFPAVIHTIDDGLLFKLSLEETKNKIQIYSERALSEISIAEKLLPVDSEKDQVQFNYVSAWIQAILWRYPRSLAEKIFPKEIKVEEIIQIIEKLSNFESSMSKSKLIISDFICHINEYKDFQSLNRGLKNKLVYSSKTELSEKTIRLFREYMDSIKNSSPVSALRISILNQDNKRQKLFEKSAGKKDYSSPTLEETSLIFESDLSVYENIANDNQNNSVLWYCYATKLLWNNKMKEYWEAIIKGNAMQAGGFLEYSLSAPKQIAWAVPTQVLIPKDFEILMSSITSGSLEQDHVSEVIQFVSKVEEASNNKNHAFENKKKLKDAVFWAKTMLLSQIVLFSEKNPDKNLPEEVGDFLRKNPVLYNRAIKSVALFKKFNK